MAREFKATPKTNIEELLDEVPQAAKVIEKYFGTGCFDCPGIKMENLEFGAMMHGADVKEMVEEINNLIKEDNSGN